MSFFSLSPKEGEKKKDLLWSIWTEQSNKSSLLIGIVNLILAVLVISTVGSQTKSISATLLLLLAMRITIVFCTCRLMVIVGSVSVVATMTAMMIAIAPTTKILGMVTAVITIAVITATSTPEM